MNAECRMKNRLARPHSALRILQSAIDLSMAKMYGILSVIGWIALVLSIGLLILLPPRKPKDSDK
jgi:uncharacterized membrane protein